MLRLKETGDDYGVGKMENHCVWWSSYSGDGVEWRKKDQRERISFQSGLRVYIPPSYDPKMSRVIFL